MVSDNFGPGRLNASWLEDDCSGDPWILETTSPFDYSGHRDAFIGNGYIGQRISIEGDASISPQATEASYPKCLVHGLWDELRLMAPPRWALLGYHDGCSTFFRAHGEWKNYRQHLDLKTAILTTETDWLDDGRFTSLTSRVFLSRSRPNIGILSRTIRPDFDGFVSFTDDLDGSHIEDSRDWRFVIAEQPDAVISLELDMGPRNRRLVVMSRLVLESISAPTLICQKSEKAVSRLLRFAVRKGQSYTVTKVVALVTDKDAPAPWLHARTLVEGAARDLVGLERQHCAAWRETWAHRIEVPHPRLQKLLNASLYQFYSHLREGGSWSLGPTGLSAKHWSGNVFWDSDLWMFPVLGLLHPSLARGFIAYRHDTLEGARRNARAEGYEGAMFPWQSAEFGDETIPDLVFHHQHHVISDIALAQWWYWQITGDEDFFREKSARIIIEAAAFWASRVTYNEARHRYEILQVCCADEFAEIQDNNTYTNYSAVKTLQLAIAISQRYDWPVPPLWEDIVAKMWLPFDEENQIFLEYDGYAGAAIKQADTALLIYPYEMPMTDEIKANTLDYYRRQYPVGNIMMAAAFDGIVDCELGRSDGGWQSLVRLMPHFRTPYLLASESPANEIMSFATGLGGLLQLVVMGFGGLRMREGGLAVTPCLPSALSWLRIVGMHYAGTSFDLLIEKNKVSVEHASGPIRFWLEDASGNDWFHPPDRDLSSLARAV